MARPPPETILNGCVPCPRGSPMSARFVTALLLVGMASSSVSAQVVYPAKPESYDVEFRYRIRTDRDERIRQYRAMTADLDKLGFVPARFPNDDLEIIDPLAELKSGTIPAKNAAALAELPAVKTVIVRKAGDKRSADAKQPVQVRIAIPKNLTGREQRLLHEQTVAHLGLLGFVEAIGYQHDAFSTIRGAMPAGAVSKLLKDRNIIYVDIHAKFFRLQYLFKVYTVRCVQNIFFFKTCH